MASKRNKEQNNNAQEYRSNQNQETEQENRTKQEEEGAFSEGEGRQSGNEEKQGQEATEDEKESTAEKEEQPKDEKEKLMAQVEDLHSRYMRAKAEQENYRKRVQRQLDEAKTDAQEKAVSEFLTVYDHFKLAMDHAEENTDYQTLKQGMDMIYTEFSKAFENLGLEEINAVGERFDPSLHEAVGHQNSNEVPEGHVLHQWQKGYQMNGRLLRPARVIVSAGPATAQDSEQSSEKEESSESGNGEQSAKSVKQ